MIVMRLILSLLMVVMIAACQTLHAPTNRFANQSAKMIFEGGIHDMLHHNYQGAADHFEALNALYPISRYNEKAQLNLIYAYYQQDNTASTLVACNRFIHLYPRSLHADYAYYLRGLTEMNSNRGILERFLPFDEAARDLTNLKKAYMDFDVLLRIFPHSLYLADAMKRMTYIRNTIARHSLEVAKFYYRQGAYIAAINRANEVIMHYQQTPMVPLALVFVMHVYRQLGLTQKATQILKVLQYNYPHSHYNEQAIKFFN